MGRAMKRSALWAIAFLALTIVSPVLPAMAADPPRGTAEAVLAEFDRLTALPLWPGFDPKRIPVAIYDGSRTVLARHPAPPSGFTRAGEVWVFPGQHPAMRANTAIDLGGASTATLLVDPAAPRGAREWASVLVHEAFHADQRARHPSWQANEMELFTYPFENAEALAGRRLETEALRRALASADPKDAACWASRALEQRRERFGRLPEGSAAYERGTELNEGLAAFVEKAALGETTGPDLPAAEYGAAEARQRAYAIGHAWAALLERFDPAWRAAMDAERAKSLDGLVASTLAGRPAGICVFSPEETAAAAEKARTDAARLSGSRQEERRAFLGRPGWTVELVAASQPLWSQGFDPLNVSNLGGGEVLHRRFLKLGNGDTTLEVLDSQALTEAAGAHPLFNGIRKLTVTGLPSEPAVRQEGTTTLIEAPGFTAKLQGAQVERKDRVLRIRWGS